MNQGMSAGQAEAMAQGSGGSGFAPDVFDPSYGGGFVGGDTQEGKIDATNRAANRQVLATHVQSPIIKRLIDMNDTSMRFKVKDGNKERVVSLHDATTATTTSSSPVKRRSPVLVKPSHRDRRQGDTKPRAKGSNVRSATRRCTPWRREHRDGIDKSGRVRIELTPEARLLIKAVPSGIAYNENRFNGTVPNTGYDPSMAPTS
jgi:hypothetical protein